MERPALLRSRGSNSRDASTAVKLAASSPRSPPRRLGSGGEYVKVREPAGKVGVRTRACRDVRRGVPCMRTYGGLESDTVLGGVSRDTSRGYNIPGSGLRRARQRQNHNERAYSSVPHVRSDTRRPPMQSSRRSLALAGEPLQNLVCDFLEQRRRWGALVPLEQPKRPPASAFR